MTVQLSPHKVGKILRGYFHGLPQTKIAKEAGVDQSSISHYATRFKEMAAKYGLPAAGKEYQVLNEVESLRSLSVELYKSKLTIEEARQGHNIIKAFLKLGINPEEHLNLGVTAFGKAIRGVIIKVIGWAPLRRFRVLPPLLTLHRRPI